MPQFFFILSLMLSVNAFAKPSADLAKLESKYNLRMGIFAQRGNKIFAHREDERFAYCSTFKWFLCAMILQKADNGKLDLEQVVNFSQRDIVRHSPVLTKHVADGGMRVKKLCAAAVKASDNTATNLMMNLLGGTSALQALARKFGDSVIRFDRLEPDMNDNTPGDLRDTTTAKAMTVLMKRLLSGNELKKSSRDLLVSWMKESITAGDRIRSAAPNGWQVASKGGLGRNGAVHDVAILFPPTGEPIFISVYTGRKIIDVKASEAAIIEATKIVLQNLN